MVVEAAGDGLGRPNYDAAGRPTPVEIKYSKDQRLLEIDFQQGGGFRLPAEFLRIESPSAEVKGHGPGQEVVVPGKRHVQISAIEPVGNYAVRLIFDDGHETGIFSWAYLFEIGTRQEELWAKYLKALDDRGLTREPR